MADDLLSPLKALQNFARAMTNISRYMVGRVTPRAPLRIAVGGGRHGVGLSQNSGRTSCSKIAEKSGTRITRPSENRVQRRRSRLQRMCGWQRATSPGLSPGDLSEKPRALLPDLS